MVMHPRRRWLVLGAAALALAACGGGEDDPCDAQTGTCVTLNVSSPTATEIDALELDVIYGDHHGTTMVAGDGAMALPLDLALALAVPGEVTPGVVVAGMLGGSVVGTAAGKLTVAENAHVELALVLAPPATCTAGGFYCGGDKLVGDPDTVYTCHPDGVPTARGVCPGACVIRTGKDDECAAVGGPCANGGKYCGGDKLTGDPSSLYSCSGGVGTLVMRCPNGCVVNPAPFADACR